MLNQAVAPPPPDEASKVDEAASTATFRTWNGWRIALLEAGDTIVFTDDFTASGIEAVASGGSGGGRRGGGGGSGEPLQISTPTVWPAGTYTAVIGAPGAAVQGDGAGNPGGNLIFGPYTLLGGGGGGSYRNPATSGASGGGEGGHPSDSAVGQAVTPGVTGNDGALNNSNDTAGGGGGGAGGTPARGGANTPGDGGPGIPSIVPDRADAGEFIAAGGAAGRFAGGSGGSGIGGNGQPNAGSATAGTDLTGSGGGGGNADAGERESARGGTGKVEMWWPA